jgi:hypothetical protein
MRRCRQGRAALVGLRAQTATATATATDATRAHAPPRRQARRGVPPGAATCQAHRPIGRERSIHLLCDPTLIFGRDALRSLRSASWLSPEPQAPDRSNRGRCPSRGEERRFLDGHVGSEPQLALDSTLVQRGADRTTATGATSRTAPFGTATSLVSSQARLSSCQSPVQRAIDFTASRRATQQQ